MSHAGHFRGRCGSAPRAAPVRNTSRSAGHGQNPDGAGIGPGSLLGKRSRHPVSREHNLRGLCRRVSPADTKSDLGFRFTPKKGHLIEAAEAASRSLKPFLLHIDEINRADMSKVLGEAIYLLEADDATPREVKLGYDFGPPFGSQLQLPKNLHIVGTMNSADRSLAVVDVAVRRRFAFAKLWPQMSVVREGGCDLMQQAFRDLVSIFVEHASDEAFDLMPGHSYFLEKDETRAQQRLKVTLAPLLEEYLTQGYVASFAEPLRSYLQWIESPNPYAREAKTRSAPQGSSIGAQSRCLAGGGYFRCARFLCNCFAGQLSRSVDTNTRRKQTNGSFGRSVHRAK